MFFAFLRAAGICVASTCSTSRRADAVRERAERAVRAGVRVAADDRHAGQRRALLRADDVHDALAPVVHLELRDAVGGRSWRRACRPAGARSDRRCRASQSVVGMLWSADARLAETRHDLAAGQLAGLRTPAGSSLRGRDDGRCRGGRCRRPRCGRRARPRSCRTACLEQHGAGGSRRSDAVGTRHRCVLSGAPVASAASREAIAAAISCACSQRRRRCARVAPV